MNATSVVIVSARRTPIGRFLGGLSTLKPTVLGQVAVQAALNGAKVEPEEVQSLFFGQARQAGSGPNPARQVLVGSGITEASPAATINQACSSGLKAIQLAADEIRLGRAQVVVAGGMESMSRVPFLLDRMRSGYRLGNGHRR